jgi:hypothetical protein
MLVSCLTYSSTLKLDATCSSETSVYSQLTAGRYIPEARTLRNHRCENIKSYINLELIFVLPAETLEQPEVVKLCSSVKVHRRLGGHILPHMALLGDKEELGGVFSGYFIISSVNSLRINCFFSINDTIVSAI